jgi:hypothetical protein
LWIASRLAYLSATKLALKLDPLDCPEVFSGILEPVNPGITTKRTTAPRRPYRKVGFR